MEYVTWILTNYAGVVAGVVAVATGLYAIALIVPGEQPDKSIKWFLDITEKFSRK